MRKYLFWLILFALVEISLALYLTIWREHFWNAVSQKQSVTFLHELIKFGGIALLICFVSGFSGYLVARTVIVWREKLNTLASSKLLDAQIENLNQRIQEDCYKYPELFLSLGFDSVKALFYILVFGISIILDFHLWMLGVLIIYTLIGISVTRAVAKPLIQLNYNQQVAEATYRNNLSMSNFGDCIRIMLGMAKKQKHLSYVQTFFGQVSVLIPLIIIAPEYFASAMTIGTLMRFNSVSNTFLENFSYPMNNFNSINKLISCRRRLKEASII